MRESTVARCSVVGFAAMAVTLAAAGPPMTAKCECGCALTEVADRKVGCHNV
jgi:hypothetical protein